LIERLGLPVRLVGSARRCPITGALAALRLDKKAAGGRPRFVLAKRIGRVVTGMTIPPGAIHSVMVGLGCTGRSVKSLRHSR